MGKSSKLLFFLIFQCMLNFAWGQKAGSDMDSTNSVDRESSLFNLSEGNFEANNWSFAGQSTYVVQQHPEFQSKYSGANSLTSLKSDKETLDLTLYIGVGLWSGAELYINPEIDQGFGLSNTVGVAGFPSGEAYKVGAQIPYYKLPRAFLRQTFNLGGESLFLENQPNQIKREITSNNVTLTIGKFSVVDIFDSNSYSHDPRSDFLNWSIIESGAFDYAADSWGFTQGAALEWTQDWWTLRAGYFALSTQPNQETIDTTFHQHEWVSEIEARYALFSQPGKIKILNYVNQGVMGLYSDAINLGGLLQSIPDTSLVRKMNSKKGWSLNGEQELTNDIGMFFKYSKSDGAKEAFDFTEINQSLSTGLLFKGTPWKRHNDSFGIGFSKNDIGLDAQHYFAMGGVGILIGDGGLRYGSERISEIFYNFEINKKYNFAIDFQSIQNPAYNRDRGPVSISGLRLHAVF
jgi:high affinity Mn2+ porin